MYICGSFAMFILVQIICIIILFTAFLAILPPGEIQPSTSLSCVHPCNWEHPLPCDHSWDVRRAVWTLLWNVSSQTAHAGENSNYWGNSCHCRDGVRIFQDGVPGSGYNSRRCGSSYDIRHGGGNDPSARQDGLSIQKKRWYFLL